MPVVSRSVDELVRGKWSADRWEDVAHLGDAELVEYLFRIGNESYHRIALLIPDGRLAALAPRLDALIAASPKSTWLSRRFNHTDAERANLVRAAVAVARVQTAAEAALGAGGSAPLAAPAARSADPPAELAEMAAERRLLQCERELLRHEIDMLKRLREENGKERLRAEREFQRRVVAGVLATLFAVATLLLVGARVK